MFNIYNFAFLNKEELKKNKNIDSYLKIALTYNWIPIKIDENRVLFWIYKVTNEAIYVCALNLEYLIIEFLTISKKDYFIEWNF